MTNYTDPVFFLGVRYYQYFLLLLLSCCTVSHKIYSPTQQQTRRRQLFRKILTFMAPRENSHFQVETITPL